jgi:hypothetical protein
MTRLQVVDQAWDDPEVSDIVVNIISVGYVGNDYIVNTNLL